MSETTPAPTPTPPPSNLGWQLIIAAFILSIGIVGAAYLFRPGTPVGPTPTPPPPAVPATVTAATTYIKAIGPAFKALQAKAQISEVTADSLPEAIAKALSNPSSGLSTAIKNAPSLPDALGQVGDTINQITGSQ